MFMSELKSKDIHSKENKELKREIISAIHEAKQNAIG